MLFVFFLRFWPTVDHVNLRLPGGQFFSSPLTLLFHSLTSHPCLLYGHYHFTSTRKQFDFEKFSKLSIRLLLNFLLLWIISTVIPTSSAFRLTSSTSFLSSRFSSWLLTRNPHDQFSFLSMCPRDIPAVHLEVLVFLCFHVSVAIFCNFMIPTQDFRFLFLESLQLYFLFSIRHYDSYTPPRLHFRVTASLFTALYDVSCLLYLFWVSM